MLLSSYLDNWWRQNFKIYLGSSSKAMADGKNKEKYGNKKCEMWLSFGEKNGK